MMDNWERGKLVDEGEEVKKRPGLNKAKLYQGQAIAAFITVAALLLLYFFLLRFSIFTKALKAIFKAISPFITGFVFAFIMTPLVKALEKQFYKLFGARAKTDEEKTKAQKRSRNLAILLSIIAILSAITLLIIAVIPEFYESIKNLVLNLPAYGDSLMASAKKFLSKNERISQAVTPALESATNSIEKYFETKLGTITGTGAKWVAAGFSAAFSVLYNLFVGIIVAIYLLGGKEYYLGLAKKIVFAVLPKKSAKNFVEIMHQANFVFSSAILGKMLDSLIIGLICFIGTSILSIPFDAIGEYKILVSIIIGVTNVIPFFGPYLGGIPCIALITCMNPIQGLIFAAFVLCLQQFDCNFLDPRIVGNRVGLKPLFVLVGCMAGGSLFGIPGMILATPTNAMIYSLVKAWMESKLRKKKLPTETAAYTLTPGAYLANGRYRDDSNADGMPDELENSLDLDENGIPDGEDRRITEELAKTKEE